MTEKGMSFSFRYATQEKPYKVLQNLEKKTKQKKMTSLWKQWNHTMIYFLVLYIINSITHC